MILLRIFNPFKAPCSLARFSRSIVVSALSAAWMCSTLLGQEIDTPLQRVDKEWRSHLEKGELPFFPLVASAVDPQTDDTWLATWGGGLVRYTAGRFDVFNQFNSGLSGDLLFDVAYFDGRIFAATIGGVSAYAPNDEQWSLFFPRRSTGMQRAWTKLRYLNGSIEAVTSVGEVWRFDRINERWALVGREDPPLPVPVEASNSLTRSNDNDRNSIAIYGPRNRTIELPGEPYGQAKDPIRADLASVELALSLFNREQSAYASRLELSKVSSGYERYGWTLPEGDLALFARNPKVLGVVGALNPTLQPILHEVVARSGIGFVSSALTDNRAEQAILKNEFAFRCYGFEKLMHRALLGHLMSEGSGKRIAIVRAGNVSDDLRASWWADAASRTGAKIVSDQPSEKVDAISTRWAKALVNANPDLIVAIRDVESTLDVVARIRDAGLHSPIVVGSRCLSESFLNKIARPVGTLYALNELSTEDALLVPEVAKAFQRMRSFQPLAPGSSDQRAMRSFDAADHLLDAIQDANGRPSEVLSRLRAMRDGAFGETHYEQKHIAPVFRASRLVDGRWVRFEITRE